MNDVRVGFYVLCEGRRKFPELSTQLMSSYLSHTERCLRDSWLGDQKLVSC